MNRILMNYSFHGVALFFLLSLFALQTMAQQTGTLKGRIRDADTGTGLPWVNIVIKGTVLGTSSGVHGDYKIDHVPAGEQTAIISFVGYKTEERLVRIRPGEETWLDINLKPGSLNLSSVQIEAERPFSAASSKAIRQFDMKVRPVRSSQDLLMLAPGLIIAQHNGGGKAEQLYMRGFDADHGTDVGIYVDGMPVNMVTHGHGQGYADLHFLIPETVEGFDVYKGPYFAQFGDFATAGSVSFQTKDHPDKNLVKLEGGMFNTGKLTTVLKIPTNSTHQSAYMAGQFYTTDGPFDSPQKFQRFNIFGKFHSHLTENSVLSLSLGAFSSGWNASGQIPTRAVNEGVISRWGAIDDMEGGTTSRENVNLKFVYGEGTDKEFIMQGYATWYDFRLFSNFTFWLNDSIDGDMIEQTDTRNIFGFNTQYNYRKPWGSVMTRTTVGGGLRADNIDVGLWHSPDRIRKTLRTSDVVTQRNLFLWADEDLIFNTRWRMQLGLRGDFFTFDVRDLIDHPDPPSYAADDLPRASTYYHQMIINPKLNVVYSPSESVDIFFNSGSGFHSNDARDVIISQRIREIQYGLNRKGYSEIQIDSALIANNFDPDQQDVLTLPRALGFEVGTRMNLGKRVILTMAAWYLHMQEELVFVGDEGTTEISGETRRIGLDLEGRMEITPWLWADVDLNLANGNYVNEPEGLNHIPLAPRVTSTGGLTAIHKSGFEGSIRYRYIGSRPANESNTIVARGYFITNLFLSYTFKGIKVFGSLENMFNAKWNEAQFDTESRLKWEPQPVSEINFTPGNPINVQFGASVEF